MSCKPCELKRQRLQAKLNALKERALLYGKEKGYDTILVFQVAGDEEEEEPTYSFGTRIPAGAVPIELLRID